MIIARATGKDGLEIFVIGLSEENIVKLKEGYPVFADASKNPGFPANIALTIFYGETERACVEQIKGLIDNTTKIIAIPKEKGKTS